MKDVPIDALVDHPNNANEIAPDRFKKLKAIVAASNKYPPVIVRDLGDGTYQILDGHHRRKICKQLGHATVRVDDWGPMTDAQALKLLATLNNLRGRDSRRKRALILQLLRATEDVDELSQYLPETPEQIVSITERAAIPAMPHDAEQEFADGVEPMTFLFDPDMAKVVRAAIRLRIQQGKLPGRSVNPMDFAGIMADYTNGRALSDIVAQWWFLPQQQGAS